MVLILNILAYVILAFSVQMGYYYFLEFERCYIL